MNRTKTKAVYESANLLAHFANLSLQALHLRVSVLDAREDVGKETEEEEKC